jgi:hypothetical protein
MQTHNASYFTEGSQMHKLLSASALTMVMALSVGVAHAQTTMSHSTTTTVDPLPTAPPDVSRSTTHSEKVIGSDGSVSKTHESTYSNGQGSTNESTTRTMPGMPPSSTSTTGTTTTTTTIPH